ncbi:MAG: protein-glutamate O-methyltransferase CheR [Desulfobulbaceae bacterium]|nr:protein-glutamate O-methyltransferase CheR [Desulfobulbaceae bacterium]
MIKITPQEMVDFSRYINDISGISVMESKRYLLENRLQSLLTEQGCNSFHELLCKAKNNHNSTLRCKIIDAIATNETYFFRDQAPFEILKHKIIPDILDRNKGPTSSDNARIRIWCAACSTGQEVYSVIMSILEILPDAGKYDIRVLGTDISNRVISQASSGRYSAHEIERGLPADLRNKYFVEENGSWRIQDEVRIMAEFKRMNLLEPFHGTGLFDIIFCRNVSIYFSEENKSKLFKKLAGILEKDGYLIVGGSESLCDVAPQFSHQRHLKGIFYQRKDASRRSVKKNAQAPAYSPIVAVKKTTLAAGLSARPKNNRSLPAVAGPGKKKDAAAGADLFRQQNRPGFPGQDSGSRPAATPPENAGAKSISTLFTGHEDIAAGEPQTLLGAIQGRREKIHSPAQWNTVKNDEQQKSLLQIIQENIEKMEQNASITQKKMSLESCTLPDSGNPDTEK